MSNTSYFLNAWHMTDFAKNLADTRKARRLTQLELANLLDIQPRLIGRWEQGKGKPQFDYILKLSEVLEVSLDYLLKGEQAHPIAEFEIKNKRLKELCKQVDMLGANDQEVVCHFLNMAVKQDKLKQLMD